MGQNLKGRAEIDNFLLDHIQLRRAREAVTFTIMTTFNSAEHEKLYNLILLAHERIKDHVHRTPIETTFTHPNLFLKCECDQLTGSFKLRGSFAKLTLGSTKAITTASTGNHALAMTYALNKLGELDIDATIFVPENCSPYKLKKLKSLKSPIKQFGFDAVEAEREARRVAEVENKIYVSPYNDYDIISGQGTIGIEIFEQNPGVEYIFVPVGGGGLIAGIAAYAKAVKPSVKIVGCSPTNNACLDLSIKAKRILNENEFPNLDTLSEGTAGGIDDDSITFDLCGNGSQLVDEWNDVSEDEIEGGVKFVFHSTKKVIEGAAGVSMFCFLKREKELASKNCVVVLCGRNISSTEFSRITKETNNPNP